MVSRVLQTPPAAELIRKLEAQHGPVMFHQSGGCCDGSSPMCYPDGEFIIGDRDVLLGVLDPSEDVAVEPDHGVPVWISGSQFATWKHTQLVLDVVTGRGGGFSLETPEGLRFLIRGRVYTPEEQATLDEDPPLTGADVERDGLPKPLRPTLISDEDYAEVCVTPVR
ncbi:DUF779 domain-containing protein [Cryptosporangium sp. NPDC048952]|uniref:DUF779 domain-containing protein n=1 Tax=Cryptosporangium sp. NPDC048952 TaxID=3363961 RepID=UPI00370F7F6B